MIIKLILTILLSISAFGIEIVVDKTIKQLDLRVGKRSTIQRNNAKEVVIASATGLMWQDDKSAKSVKKNWNDSNKYCQSLKHAGYDDWYLPSIKELESIVDITRLEPSIKPVFVNVRTRSHYWSSSTFV